MKGKMLIYICFIFSLIGCDKHLTINEVENALRGNTFVTTFKGMDVPLTMDFQDSTYAVFENNFRNNNWKVFTKDNKVYLEQFGGVIEIYEVDQNNIKGKVITNDSLEVRFEKQDVLYNIEDLEGAWVEDKFVSSLNSDLPKPPLPPGPEGTSAGDYQWPPLYTITDSKIDVRYDYRTRDSDILVFNSVCCVMINIKRPGDMEDKKWKIKSLNDSILVINRSSNKSGSYSDNVYEEDVKLVKIE